MKSTESLKLKNSINKIKNAIENIGNRAYQMEEIISDLENKKVEMIRVKKEIKISFCLIEII